MNTLGQDPCVSKTNWLHADNFRIFFIKFKNTCEASLNGTVIFLTSRIFTSHRPWHVPNIEETGLKAGHFDFEWKC